MVVVVLVLVLTRWVEMLGRNRRLGSGEMYWFGEIMGLEWGEIVGDAREETWRGKWGISWERKQ